MGGVVIDGRAALQFKGSLSDFKKVIEGMEQLQRNLGPGVFGFDPIPLLDETSRRRTRGPGVFGFDPIPIMYPASIAFILQFKGTLSKFEELIDGLEKIRQTVAIETVPIPDIGTWPTPERPKSPFGWSIYTHIDKGKSN